MAWYNKQDEQAQEQWNSRVAHKRLDLSASVEETLRDDFIQEVPEPDEVDSSIKPPKGSTLIPPRLSLQSKYMPALSSNGTSEDSKSLPAPAAEERGVNPTANSNIISRFAQRLTSSLSSFSGRLQPSLPSDQRGASVSLIDEVVSAPAGGHIAQNHSALYGHVTSSARSTGTPVQNGQRFAKHTTKVRLQVVPKVEETHKVEEFETPARIVTASPDLPEMARLEKAMGTIVPENSVGLSGSGSFESGQSDLVVTNPNITTSSVVVVVLTGDPGPVVVQYVTLRPNVGFTVHLSAPAKNKTPFNYTIL